MINQYLQTIALVAIIATAVGGLSMLMAGLGHPQQAAHPAMQRQSTAMPGLSAIRP